MDLPFLTMDIQVKAVFIAVLLPAHEVLWFADIYVVYSLIIMCFVYIIMHYIMLIYAMFFPLV
jgi:hypothetical protein